MHRYICTCLQLKGLGGLLWWGTRKYIGLLHHWGAHVVFRLKWFTLSFEALSDILPFPPTGCNLASITHFHREKINTVSVCHSESSAFYFDLFLCCLYLHSFLYTFPLKVHFSFLSTSGEMLSPEGNLI